LDGVKIRAKMSERQPTGDRPAILCGIVFLLSASVCSARDGAVEGTDHIDAKSFRCLTEMTHVRQFYVDNLLGNLDATLAVANSATGGTSTGHGHTIDRARVLDALEVLIA